MEPPPLRNTQADEDFGDQQVNEEDQDGGGDDRLSGGAAHTLRAAGRAEAVVTAHHGNDHGEHERLEKSENDVVGPGESLPNGGPVKLRGQAEEELSNDPPAAHSDEVGDDGEERQHGGRGDEPWRDELLFRIGAERAHGVDLLRDLHGSELAGYAGGVAAGDHDGGEDRTELADERQGYEGSGLADLSVGGEGLGHLEGHDRAGEEAGNGGDAQAADADDVHLQNDVVPIMGCAEDVADGTPGENKEILDRCYGRFQQIQQVRSIPEPQC